MTRISIIGLGLMGASLGLALKHGGFACLRRGYARREEIRGAALDSDVVDETFDDPAKAVEGADIVVFCLPVRTIPDLVKACAGHFKDGAILTDVGSTKAELVRVVGALIGNEPVTFIGSHPIAGSEQQGLAAARADLYERAVTIVTPEQACNEADVRRVCGIWEAAGSVTRVMSPDAHDEIMAQTSHLPHMVAALLVRSVTRTASAEDLAPYCGTGMRDTTRIAAGSPEMWVDIVQSNKRYLLKELKGLGEELEELVSLLERSDAAALQTWLEDARQVQRLLVQSVKQHGDESST